MTIAMTTIIDCIYSSIPFIVILAIALLPNSNLEQQNASSSSSLPKEGHSHCDDDTNDDTNNDENDNDDQTSTNSKACITASSENTIFNKNIRRTKNDQDEKKCHYLNSNQCKGTLQDDGSHEETHDRNTNNNNEKRNKGQNDKDHDEHQQQQQQQLIINAMHRKGEFLRSTKQYQCQKHQQYHQDKYQQQEGLTLTYGYPTSKKGYIDTWRKQEFPGLIPPIMPMPMSMSMPTIQLQPPYTTATTTPNTIHSDNNQNNQENELEIYLDYAGSSIPSLSLLNNIHYQSIQPQYQILANPHSSGIAASRSMEIIEKTKKRVLDFFHAHAGPLYGFIDSNNNNSGNGNGNNDNEQNKNYSPSDYHPGYDVIFTSGASESLRIIGEHFQWIGQRSYTKNTRTSTSTGSDSDSDKDTSSHNRSDTSSDTRRSVLVYPKNSHTSVIGMRECAMAKGATFHCEETETIFNANNCDMFHKWELNHATCTNNSDDIGINIETNKDSIDNNGIDNNVLDNDVGVNGNHDSGYQEDINHLLVLPLECNFGGRRPRNAKDIIKASQKQRRDSTKSKNGSSSSSSHKWFTMLDVAKAACTQEVNLREIDPDFACVSFYKIFGCPTGVGALFVKRSSKHVILPTSPPLPQSQSQSQSLSLSNNTTTYSAHINKHRERRYFGGGAVDVVLPGSDFVAPRSNFASLSSIFTHGTINFRGIMSLLPGFDEIDSLGGIRQISNHSKSLAVEAVKRLKCLRHCNNREAIIIYGPWSNLNVNKIDGPIMNDQLPGPTIAFNVVRHDGSFVGYNEVSKLASLNKAPIQLRTGCFCNPGGCQEALHLGDNEIKENYLQGGHVCGDEIDIINGKPTGAIRISFGKDSIWEDLDSLILFLERTFVSIGFNVCDNREEMTALHSLSQKEATLSEMYIYPIKSCAAMKVSKWKISKKTGALKFDREFALVDSSGLALRLSTYPKMGLIQPFIDLNAETLTVQGSGFPDLVIDLGPSSCINPLTREIKVCGNKCGGTLWGSHAASQWFSSFLDVQCWLARYTTEGKYVSYQNNRGKSLTGATTHLNSLADINGNRTGFENEAPILLLSQNSVNRLNQIMTSQGSKNVNSMYFRPNFVVDVPIENNCMTNPEDSWSKVTLTRHNLELSVIGQCARCSMVDIDPASGTKGGKTLRALAEYRRRKGRINFGIFLSSKDDEFFSDNREVLLEQGEKLIIQC